jgi:L-asparaginase II
VLAEVIRGGCVESTHRGSAVVVDADGDVLASWGDPGRQILPRSSLKPAQASAMVRAGLDLDDHLLALAAASHSGERFHRESVQAMLDAAGIDVDMLGNPPDLPYGMTAREEFLAAGGMRSKIAMNCSGKHAAMLITTAQHGWSIPDYLNPEHPLQRLIQEEITALAGEQPWAVTVDGCGAPLFGLTLTGLARLGSQVVTAPPGTPANTVADAMRANPTWVAGTDRDSAALMGGVPGLLAKEGAEGVYLVALADGRSLALKISDGSDRARAPIAAAILAHLEVEADVVTTQSQTVVLAGGRPVGLIRATLGNDAEPGGHAD